MQHFILIGQQQCNCECAMVVRHSMLEQLGMAEIAHGLLLFCPHFAVVLNLISLYLYQN